MNLNLETDPTYHYDSISEDFDWETNQVSPPTKDVSLVDNTHFNASLLIVVILGLIIGYLLRKDSSRKKEVEELTRKLNEANTKNI